VVALDAAVAPAGPADASALVGLKNRLKDSRTSATTALPSMVLEPVRRLLEGRSGEG
jgi:hypothetical protein